MMNPSKLMILSSIAALAGCTEPDPGTKTPTNFSDCLIDDGDAIALSTGDGYAIEGDAVIQGDTLKVLVGYSGGCEAHEFSICWPDQSFMESNPVQVGLALFHNANNDICEAYISEEIELDLTPLRVAYEDGYGASSGTILIRFNGEQLTYDF